MLSEGGTRMLSVKPGPSPEARITGVRVDFAPVHAVVLVFDRPVDEPLLRVERGIEERLAELEAEIARQAELIEKSCGCIPS